MDAPPKTLDLNDAQPARSHAAHGSPAPSWEDFCARMKDVWPETLPDNRDPKWTNLYTVYEIGYGACLLHMQQLLEQENSD